jgi:hypothetical protein
MFRNRGPTMGQILGSRSYPWIWSRIGRSKQRVWLLPANILSDEGSLLRPSWCPPRRAAVHACHNHPFCCLSIHQYRDWTIWMLQAGTTKNPISSISDAMFIPPWLGRQHGLWKMGLQMNVKLALYRTADTVLSYLHDLYEEGFTCEFVWV